jgi:hypothetical protein
MISTSFHRYSEKYLVFAIPEIANERDGYFAVLFYGLMRRITCMQVVNKQHAPLSQSSVPNEH